MFLKYKDEISMILIILCFAGLIFVIWNSRRKEKADISDADKVRLQNAMPKSVSVDTVNGIRKSRWVQVFIMIVGYRLGAEIIFGGLGLLYGPSRHMYTAVIMVVGIVLIATWVFYDIIMTKRVDDKVIIPGYIQSTFSHRGRKTAQIIYYDYVKNIFRMKTISLNRFEKEHDKIYPMDNIYIIASEKYNCVKFVALYEREPGFYETIDEDI